MQRTFRRLVALAGLAVLAAGLFPTFVSAAPTVHASGSHLSYVRGYAVEGSWLCYGWPNGAYHCTQHWHRTRGGTRVSDNASWVPNVASAPTSPVPQPTAQPVSYTPGGSVPYTFCHGGVSFANVSQWSVPSGCYSQIFAPNPSRYPSAASWGWCNWWPEVNHGGGYNGLNAPGHSMPRVGATVWFPAGDQGASSDGHYAVVEQIGPGAAWVLVSEMNFFWRGGGFGKVDYRYVRVDGRVSFRY